MSIMSWILVAATAFILWFLIDLWMARVRAWSKSTDEALKEAQESITESSILLADDSVTIQKVVELTFANTPVRLVCESDGESAVNRLKNEKFDLIIADAVMPAANGYEVCEHAKTLYPKTPVILLVGAFENFDEALYESCGAEEVLKKPFDSADLLRVTGALLKKQSRKDLAT